MKVPCVSMVACLKPVTPLPPRFRAAGSYYRPEGFALGQLGEFAAQAEHIVDDANSTEPNNVAQRVEQFVTAAQNMAAHIEGNDIMFTMGGMSPRYRVHAAEQAV
jgi:hypothetical protein